MSLLVAGYDENGPHLYQLDPSGAYYGKKTFEFSWFLIKFAEWKAAAIGKNMKNAKTFLEKRYNPEMELQDAIHTALLTLKEGFEGFYKRS